MSVKKDRLIGLLILLTLVGYAGCSDKNLTARKPSAQKPKAAAETPVMPLKEEKIEKEVYTYEAKGRREPFMSLIVAAKEKVQRKKRMNPIENYDVDEIRLTAIAWDSKQYYALITLPDNKSYTVRKGMTLGLYSGKIEDITNDTLLIREQIKDYKGQLKTKDTILKLRKEGEE